MDTFWISQYPDINRHTSSPISILLIFVKSFSSRLYILHSMYQIIPYKHIFYSIFISLQDFLSVHNKWQTWCFLHTWYWVTWLLQSLITFCICSLVCMLLHNNSNMNLDWSRKYNRIKEIAKQWFTWINSMHTFYTWLCMYFHSIREQISINIIISTVKYFYTFIRKQRYLNLKRKKCIPFYQLLA